MINSTERSDILVFNCYLCHVRYLLTCYVYSTKIGEFSDKSKCFENFVSQALGVLTRIYAAELRNKKIKKRIAQSFGLQVVPFESWLTIITVTRNSCCHHARVWNRVFSIRATMPIRMSRPWITLPTDPLKVYFDMCIIKYFLDIISPNNDMLDKMNRLFATFPEVDMAALGFPSGWENEPLWQ
ncbi:Abi family protein [Prevotella melaninogenica]